MAPTPSRRLLLALPLIGLASRAEAQFGRVTQARLRLLRGAVEPDGTRLAGIHIALDRGWKTYWRHPGDSGIPPVFDWSRSDNLAEADVLFPPPDRVSDGTGDILAFSREVVFAVRAVPRERARPITLRLTLEFGICEQVCIPAEMQAETVLDGRPGPAGEAAQIAQTVARAPRPVPPGSVVTAWRSDGSGAARSLEFATALAPGVRHAVVEGPEGWRVPLPRRIGTLPDGADHWRIDRLRIPAGADPGGPLRVTVFGTAGAVEEMRRLD